MSRKICFRTLPTSLPAPTIASGRAQAFPSQGQTEGLPHCQGATKCGCYLGPLGDPTQNPTEQGQGLCILQAPPKIRTSTKAMFLKQQRNHPWVLEGTGSNALCLGWGPRRCT